ncbi:MAG: zinc ribbon domain-containing protein [Candidatus Lokiarchaeota archaeon]|nr:zinc ribbon domain-containing protein [Candidatus Lokiarchaeota archaeon]
MYCTHCGSEIPDDAKFCPFCAELVVRSTSPQIQPTQPTQPPQPPPTPYQGTSATPTKSSNTGGRIIAALCIVFIVGGIFIYFGTTMIPYIPGTAITLLVIGSIVILCIGCSVCGGCGSRRRRGSYVGGGGCSGCDCSGCDCDCGGCDC